MAEPGKVLSNSAPINREKSYRDIADQRDRLIRRIGDSNPERLTRVLRTSQRYLNNIVDTDNYGQMVDDYAKLSDRVERMGRQGVGSNPLQAMLDYREAKADRDAARWAINSFPYPRSVYMKRRNNR